MLGEAENTEFVLLILTLFSFSVALSSAWSHHLSLYPGEQLQHCIYTSLGQTNWIANYDYCRQGLVYISLHTHFESLWALIFCPTHSGRIKHLLAPGETWHDPLNLST